MAGSKLPSAPTVSTEQRYIAGHAITVYGLAELSQSGSSKVSVLWLHHGRLRSPSDMADIAARCVVACSSGRRGLIAITLDQRNHGGRQVSALANEAWRAGNPMHAQDMFGMIAGMVVDNRLLIDLVQGFLFPEKEDGFIDAHYVLGVSLGGHEAWQLLFADERITVGVCIIGCPDYMALMSDRARLSKLPTFGQTGSFLGSKDFPPDLVRACKKFDPKALVFGTDEPQWPLPSREAEVDARKLIGSRLHGKRILNCSGGDDKLVPYRCSKPFLEFLKQGIEQWTGDGLRVMLDDRVYPGTGHEFSDEMATDAVEFIKASVAESEHGPTPKAADNNTAKI